MSNEVDEFLKIMEEIIPWNEWITLIKPHYFGKELVVLLAT